MTSLRKIFLLLGWLALLLPVQSVNAQEIRYFYDEVGRLIGVVDEQGNAARYIYDEVGNIIEIRRTNVGDFTGPVAITFFDPDRGEVGTEVTIQGCGKVRGRLDGDVHHRLGQGGPPALRIAPSLSVQEKSPEGIAIPGPLVARTVNGKRPVTPSSFLSFRAWPPPQHSPRWPPVRQQLGALRPLLDNPVW